MTFPLPRLVPGSRSHWPQLIFVCYSSLVVPIPGCLDSGITRSWSCLYPAVAYTRCGLYPTAAWTQASLILGRAYTRPQIIPGRRLCPTAAWTQASLILGRAYTRLQLMPIAAHARPCIYLAPTFAQAHSSLAATYTRLPLIPGHGLYPAAVYARCLQFLVKFCTVFGFLGWKFRPKHFLK